MRTKVQYIAIFFLLAIAVVGGFWYWKNTQIIPVEIPETTETLMRNLSWGTELESFTPYKKNDDLEFVFIAEAGENTEASVDLSKLKEKIDITSIEVNDQIQTESSLNGLAASGALKVTVRGKAKENTINKTNTSELAQIRFSKKKEVATSSTGEIQKPTATKHPINITLPTETLSSNIDNLIPVTGENLDAIDQVMVGEKSFRGSIKDNIYYFILPKNTFGNGEFFVGLYLKNGELVPTNSKLSFTYNSNPINIAAITPNTIKNDKDQYIVVQGNGFKKMVSLQLSNNLIFKNALFTIINDQVISVKIPKGLEPGTYSFNMMDTDGIYEAKNKTFTVTQ